MVGYQMTNDYKGRDYTASFTAVNNDIVQNTGKSFIGTKDCSNPKFLSIFSVHFLCQFIMSS
jgi:hypothetical protein